MSNGGRASARENRPATLEHPLAAVCASRASQKLRSAKLKALCAKVIVLRPEVVGMVCKVVSLAVAVPSLAISRLWASRAAFKGLHMMPGAVRVQ
jgi:hypothetical protein